MKQLIYYEWKKLWMKKSTIAVLVILFTINLVFVGISGSLGKAYVEGEFYETHKERNRIVREYGLELSGSLMDDTLLGEMQNAYQKVDRSSQAYKWTDIYKNEVRKYDAIEGVFKQWGLNSNVLNENVTEAFAGTTMGERIYLARTLVQEQLYKEYFLTEQEIAYWETKNESVETPFIYQYAQSYESLSGMQGIYMICMLITFFIAITMVGVFADEHVRKTDQLVLCTRLGRTKVYYAKLIAGGFLTFIVTLSFLMVAIAGKFYSYGTEGFEAMIQVVAAYWYPYEMTIGEACLMMGGLLLLSSVLVAVFAMLLAELLKSGVGTMAVIVGLLMGARLVVFPMEWRVLSQIWNYMPINLLKIDVGFTDLRTVNLFGIRLTSWQFAPLLYSMLIIALVVLGKRIYNHYQVSGR